MKRLVLVAALVLLVAGIIGSQSSAQEPPLDLGETNLLTLACDYTIGLANNEGLTVKNCRRHKPEIIEGYKAEATVRIVTNEFGPFVVTVRLSKSLWGVRGAYVH